LNFNTSATYFFDTVFVQQEVMDKKYDFFCRFCSSGQKI
jgi:hypothetical protein